MLTLNPQMTAEPIKNPSPSLWTTSSDNLQRTGLKFFASRFWQLVAVAYRRVVAVFTHHPAETNETYLQHLWFTIKTSLRFVSVGVLLLLHGIFPFLLTRTASNQIEKIYRIMRSRIPQSRRKTIESEYEI